MHAGLVKTPIGEANKGCIEDLATPIWNRICLGLVHRFRKMNERSFIVKSDISSHFCLGRRCSCLRTLATNRDKDAPLRRKARHSAQRDAPVLFEISCHGFQDFVSHPACTVCETTGTGCAVGSNPANGSGVGCPMNWKIATTTLKMHVA